MKFFGVVGHGPRNKQILVAIRITVWIQGFWIWIVDRVPTGQGKLEKVREFDWSGKVRERSGKNSFLEKSGKSQGK